MRRISWQSGRIWASQEWLCSMELICYRIQESEVVRRGLKDSFRRHICNFQHTNLFHTKYVSTFIVCHRTKVIQGSRWRRCVPPQRWYLPASRHSITSQKKNIDTIYCRSPPRFTFNSFQAFFTFKGHPMGPPMSVCHIFQPRNNAIPSASSRGEANTRVCTTRVFSVPHRGLHPGFCPIADLSPGVSPSDLPHFGALPTGPVSSSYAPPQSVLALAGLEVPGLLPSQVISPRARDCSRGTWPLTRRDHLRGLRPLGTPPGNSIHASPQPGFLPLGCEHSGLSQACMLSGA
jgi:hypothetical protein